MSDYYPPGSNTKDAPWNDDRLTWVKKYHRATCDVCENRTATNDEMLCEECFDNVQDQYEENHHSGRDRMEED